MDFQPFQIRVPCSTSNLGPGFDSLGLALNRYLSLTFHPAKTRTIEYHGDALIPIPLDDRNLIIKVMKERFAEAGQPLPHFHLRIDNEIPLTRGLGSSAAAIVGALIAANHLLGNWWSKEELLLRATQWEGHPDNVGPSLYGGLFVGSYDGKNVHFLSLAPPDLPLVAVIPEQPLSTKKARQVLPTHYAKEDAVLSSSRANLLVAALLTKRWDLLREAMKDTFHQPYREPLVPGLKELLNHAREHGAYGVALSGAGPTIIAFAEDVKRLISYVEDVFAKLDVAVKIAELHAVREGARVVEVE